MAGYSDKFLTQDLKPKTAISIVLQRLRRIRTVDTEVKEYLSERSQIEEIQSKSWLKLHKKLLADHEKLGNDTIGTFAEVWNHVIQNVNELGMSHALIAEKMSGDLLATMSSQPAAEDWGKLKTLESNLTKLAKDLDEKTVRLAKTNTKQAEKHAKAAKKQKEAHDAWNSEAKQAFQKMEEMDRMHMKFLKDNISKLVQVQVDNLRLHLLNLEQVMKSVEEISIDAEINTFAEKFSKEPAVTEHSEKEPTTPTFNSTPIVKPNSMVSSPGPGVKGTIQPPSPVKAVAEVDSEGYKIPQMDREKWRKSVFADDNFKDDDDDPTADNSNNQKIKISIQNESKEVESPNALQQALNSTELKDIFTLRPPNSTMTRTTRRGHRSQPSGGSELSATESNFSAISKASSNQVNVIEIANSLSPATKAIHVETSVPTTGVSASSAPPLIPDLMGFTPPTSPHPASNSISKQLWSKQSLSVKIHEALTVHFDAAGKLVKSQLVGNVACTLDSLENIPTGAFAQLSLPSSVNGLAIDSLSSAVKADGSAIRVDLNAFQNHSKTLMFKYSHDFPNADIIELSKVKISGKMKIQSTQTQLIILCESTEAVVRLQEASILVTADSHASNIVTKPSAVCNDEKKKILWKQEQLNIGGANGSAKFLAQWAVQEPSHPNPIAIKYQCSHPSASRFKFLIHMENQSVVDALDRLDFGPLVTSVLVDPTLVT